MFAVVRKSAASGIARKSALRQGEDFSTGLSDANGGSASRGYFQPPAIAPITKNGSFPVATDSGKGLSVGSWDQSSSQAKNRKNARRFKVS
jgi:hypothetical protein